MKEFLTLMSILIICRLWKFRTVTSPSCCRWWRNQTV